MWRSALFIPATEPRFLDKAAERGADAIVLDLEASVVTARKAEARAAVAAGVERLAGSGLDILVRVNMGWRLPFLDVGAAAGFSASSSSDVAGGPAARSAAAVKASSKVLRLSTN